MDIIHTLIIEDDVKIAEIQRIFTEKINGFEVVGIAHSISDAEEMVTVLLDIFFPDGNGIDLLWKIRKNQKRTDVVLITAAKEVEFFEEALRGGVYHILHQSDKHLPDSEEMPKGIDPITLKKVQEILKTIDPAGISAEKAGALIGVSRTTSRRYLEYLVANGVITADLSYGAQGRPERVYLKKS